MADPSKEAGRARGLGRGLTALMADLAGAGEDGARPDLRLPVDQIRPNPDQPRRTFEPAALAELAASIREKGVIQPLIVRPDPHEAGLFQIAAGERRWRAAQAAGLAEVPAIVRDYDDAELLEVALVENVQRADLNAIDEGGAYRALMERFGHTQEQVATALGKSRSHVANQLRLLSLPVDVQDMVADARLSPGHARPLVGHPDAAALARRIAERRLSVRDAERLAKLPALPERPRGAARPQHPDVAVIERELAEVLRTRVRIDHPPGSHGGRLTISYRDGEHLDHLLRALLGG